MNLPWKPIFNSARFGAAIGLAAAASAAGLLLVRLIAPDASAVLLALLATLLFWGALRVFRIEEVAFIQQFAQIPGIVSSFAFVSTLIAFGLILQTDPKLAEFYCAVNSANTLWLALIVSGTLGILSGLASTRAAEARLSLLIHISFFWCAPFLGFLFGPVFLAQALVLRCSYGSLGTILAASVGMLVAGRLGLHFAAWFGDRRL